MKRKGNQLSSWKKELMNKMFNMHIINALVVIPSPQGTRQWQLDLVDWIMDGGPQYKIGVYHSLNQPLKYITV